MNVVDTFIDKIDGKTFCGLGLAITGVGFKNFVSMSNSGSSSAP